MKAHLSMVNNYSDREFFFTAFNYYLIIEMLMSYGKQGYRKLKSHIESTVLPSLLTRSHFDGFNKRQVMFVKKLSWCFIFNLLDP